MLNSTTPKKLFASLSLLTMSLFGTLHISDAHANEDWPALLAQKPAFYDFKISPDGKHLSAIVFQDGKRTLVFFDVTNMKVVGIVRMEQLLEVGEYHWVTNERVVFKLVESKPWEKEPSYYGELYGVDVDGGNGQLLFGYRAAAGQTGSNIKTRKSRNAWAEFIDIAPDKHDRILIQSTPATSKGDNLAEVLEMNIYNGKTVSRGKVPVPYASVMAGIDGAPRVVTGTNEKNETEVYIKATDSNDWQELPQQQFGTSFQPIAISKDNNSLYVFDNKGQDKSGVFKLNLKDGSYENIYTDPVVDVSEVNTTADQRSVYGLRVDDGLPAYMLLTSAFDEAKIFKELLSAFPGEQVTITSVTEDAKKWIVAVHSDINPASYYLYDHEKQSLGKIADGNPQLTGKKLAPMQPVKFASFDGKEVHGYLTLSEQQSAAKPMVVLVHGGPHGIRDRWGYDPEVQLLAQSGYNVLQVNYRGSGGYGQAFMEAGYRQWGDAIQKDIIAGT